ncbi:vitamin K epoxide reductase family protein, partial [Chloroflexota bacterium]
SELPGLIQMHLAEGGLEYPDYPSLAAYLPESINSDELSQPSTDTIEEKKQASENTSIDVEREAQDAHPAEGPESSGANGFTLAGVILVAMVLGIVYVIYALIKGSDGTEDQRSKWIGLLIPLLTLAGIGVSGYLTYVETQAVEAICGPVGDCNAVQNSSYARLFGVLPIGILGLIGFAMILIAWLVQWLRHDKLGSFASLAMLGMSLFGTIFSIYLTYLEIWVIEAVCIWCLSSAVLITTLLLLSVQPAQQAFDSFIEE